MRPFLTLHTPARTRAFYETGLWREQTLYDLLSQHATARPDAPAIRDGRVCQSWSELRKWVDGVAAALRGRGLTRGDRVSIWMSNRVESVVMFLACVREGLACNPSLHRTHTCEEVRQLLVRLSSRALLTEPGWGADRATTDFEQMLASLPQLKAVYTPANFPAPGEADVVSCDDPDKVSYLAFTSGTTGEPKCVMHSDNTLLANARELVAAWGHDADTVLLSLSPLSHHIAWVAVAQWLLAGCQFVTDDAPAGHSRLDWLIATGATYVMGVPTHAIDMLAEQAARQLPRLGKVRIFYMAGSSIPQSVAERFVTQGIKPQNVYGMTENSSHQYTHPDDDSVTVVTTCGRGGRAYEVKLFDPENRDRPVAIGEVGEIGGRGAALMLGYFGNQTATEASFNAEGWFMSGDLGRLNARGDLRIEGRVKDLIIRGGHNIYPAHIEALSLRHPLVEKAACFAVPDPRLGERICIAVIGAVDPADLLDHLQREGLSRFDMPEQFLRLETLPLTASGKILKRTLAARVRSGELRPTPIRGHRAGSTQS